MQNGGIGWEQPTATGRGPFIAASAPVAAKGALNIKAAVSQCLAVILCSLMNGPDTRSLVSRKYHLKQSGDRYGSAGRRIIMASVVITPAQTGWLRQGQTRSCRSPLSGRAR